MLAGTPTLATNQLLRNLRETKFAFSRKGGKESKDAKRFLRSKN
jgi:hypothetical protein